MTQQTDLRWRTAIMIICLVALPVAAVLGLKWPRPTTVNFALKSRRPVTPASSAKTTSEPATPDRSSIKGNEPGYPVRPTANIAVRAEADAPRTAASADVPSGIPQDAAAEAVPIAAERPKSEAVKTDNNLNDPFSQIQQRLRALGALYYSLETVGMQGDKYRFECRMANEQNPQYSRFFEATDADPLRVMHIVLEEIEAWKSGRVP